MSIQAAVTQPAPVGCPSCSAPMGSQDLPTLGARDHCGKCQSVWLRKGDLATICIQLDDFPKTQDLVATAVPTTHRCLQCPGATLSKVPYTPDGTLKVERCAQCGGIWTTIADLGAIRRFAAGVGKPVHDWHWDMISPAAWEIYYAIPIAAALASIIQRNGLLELFFIPVVVQLHELGHALHAWLAGRIAIPLIAVTIPGEWGNRAAVFLVMASALGAMIYWNRLKGRLFLPAVGAILLVAQVYMTFLLGKQEAEACMIFGGIAGQLYFSTLMVIAFYYEMPEKMRWGYWRNVCLVMGMFAFEHTFAFWRAVAAGRKALPKGSLIGGEGDTNGDINRLIAEHGWTEFSLTTAYNSIGTLCLVIIWGHYVWRLHRSTKESPH